MFLVYLYGRRHREGVNAYPIVEPHHFISYEEGIERNLDQLPPLLEEKLRYGDELQEIEEELRDGLTQIRIDARQHRRNRTHPLAESRTAENRMAHLETITPQNQSMTSTTSTSSHLVTEDEKIIDSPKRPRSEYSKNG